MKKFYLTIILLLISQEILSMHRDKNALERMNQLELDIKRASDNIERLNSQADQLEEYINDVGSAFTRHKNIYDLLSQDEHACWAKLIKKNAETVEALRNRVALLEANIEGSKILLGFEEIRNIGR